MSEWTAESAQQYADKYGEYATNKLAVQRLELAPNMILVDIGCGTGYAMRLAAAKITEGKLIGIDPVGRMIQIAQEKTDSDPAKERIEYHHGQASRLPLASDFADIVFAFDSYDHWADKYAGLAEVSRVLKSGGRFVVVKDTQIPQPAEQNRSFQERLAHTGFSEISETAIAEDGVSLLLWQCKLQSSQD